MSNVEIPTGLITQPIQEVEIPTGLIAQPSQEVEIPTGLIPPTQQDEFKGIHVTNLQGLSITDNLIHIKADRSFQCATRDVNYFNLSNKQLYIYIGGTCIRLDTPSLTKEQLAQIVPPFFYKLTVDDNLICLNQLQTSFYMFENNMTVITFRNDTFLKVNVQKDQQEAIFTKFAEHHELILRTNC